MKEFRGKTLGDIYTFFNLVTLVIHVLVADQKKFFGGLGNKNFERPPKRESLVSRITLFLSKKYITTFTVEYTRNK